MLQPVLVALGAPALALWLAVLLDPARPWTLRPVAEDELEPPEPGSWPSVTVLVPARNEAEYLPETIPGLLAQDYPGSFEVLVVDDRSVDGTREIARGLGAPVVAGAALPEGWVGKVWALEQGRRAASAGSEYLLLTDADIVHGPRSLRTLVAGSEACGLALNSRMARLRAESAWERLLVPAFLYFFNLLYPMRRANAGRRPAAAGGCILVHRAALEAAGGFAAIRGAVIDDLTLARRVAAGGGRIRLAVSRQTVVSARRHARLESIWRMVTRTAFTELRESWVRLAAALLLLAVMFPVPPVLVASIPWTVTAALLGAASWILMTLTYLPAVRFFSLSPLWALTLPLAGVLYAAMTLSSGLGASQTTARGGSVTSAE